MKNLMPVVGGDVNTITATKNVLVKNECENTINPWERKCPKCNKTLHYSSIKLQKVAAKNNTFCKKCKLSSEETRQKMSIAHIGFKHTSQHRRKICGSGNPMYGIHRYDTKNPFHGKHHTDEARRKMRIAACKRVLELQRNGKDGRINNVGLKEGAYFAQMEKERGWDGIYYEKSKKQFLIEDLGYFVDYYEPNLNIVVEYDEPRHYRNGVLRERDVKRMKEIKTHLGCQFWRYDVYRKQFVKS